MSFTCKRCRCDSTIITDRELICESCKADLDLLESQQSVNSARIKKLEEHKKSVESEMANPASEEDKARLSETMKRLNHNLNIEYKLQKGILEAIDSKSDI